MSEAVRTILDDNAEDSESSSNPNNDVQFWVKTGQFGETPSVLQPGYNNETNAVKGVYDIEVPEPVLELCERISGLGGKALLVGGCVRDAVISHELDEFDITPKDFDLEVYGLKVETLNHLLESEYANADRKGEAFAVIKIPIEGLEEPLDISIPRRDSKSGKGHKGFEVSEDPTMSVAEAATRRDLTINSLAYDPLTKTVYDSFGALDDVKERSIRVTDRETFQEDPLRVLRIMQFASRFNFEVAGETIELCKEMVARGDMDELPPERITEEFGKLMLKGKKPSVGLEFAREVGITEKYWPELHALIGVKQDEKWHPEGDVYRHTLQVVDAASEIADREKLSKDEKLILTLAALAHDFGKLAKTTFEDGRWRSKGHEAAGVEPAKNFLNNFIFNEKHIKWPVLALVPDHMSPKAFWLEANKGTNMNRAINRLSQRLASGRTNIHMLSLLAEADQRGRNPDTTTMDPLKRGEVKDLKEWQTWLNNKAKELKVNEKPPEKILQGGELMKQLGIKRGGPHIGVLIDAVYADQLDGEIRNPQEALARAKFYHDAFTEVVADRKNEEQMQERDIWDAFRSHPDVRILVPKPMSIM